MAIEILTTDQVFQFSPDAGHPHCICSRCGAAIKEEESVLRSWTTNENDDVDENSMEYRYCEQCQAAMGIHPAPVIEDDEVDDNEIDWWIW